jgi:hypothetical protein
MGDEKLPDHETLEKWVKDQPLDCIKRLPDNLERRRAEEHVAIAYDYARQSREKKADRHA